MKKLVLFASALAMLVSFNACTPEPDPTPTPKPDINPHGGGNDAWVQSRPTWAATTDQWVEATDQLDVFIDGDEIQVTQPFETLSDQWQSQVFIMSATPVAMEEGKNYKWTVNVTSNIAGKFYSKITYPSDDAILNNFELNKDLAAGNNTFTLVRTAEAGAEDVEFVFGLGRNEANISMVITMSVVETTEPADEIVEPEPEPDSEFTDMTGIDTEAVAFTLGVYKNWIGDSNWGDITAGNFTTTVNGNSITHTVVPSTYGSPWFNQLFLSTGVSVDEGDPVKVTFTITSNYDQIISLSIGEWDTAQEKDVKHINELNQITLTANTPKEIILASTAASQAISPMSINMGLGNAGENCTITISNVTIEK